jgi:DNA-binding response OmpR family regulator
MSRRLLVLGSPGHALGVPLPDAFLQHAPSLTADHADPGTETLDGLAARGYDAVVCWAERPEELELVVRIRRSSPQTPIVLLTSLTTPEFRALALERGANSVLPAVKNLPALVGLIEQAVELRATARESRQRAAEGRALSKEVRELAQKTNARSQDAFRRLSLTGRRPLLPLLVCDDPEQAFQMVRAFARAEIFAPLPILRTGDEARAYLSGQTPYENRERHPLPSLLLLDLHGEGAPGLVLLSWIRQQPRLQHLPVVMLSATVNPEDIKKAYGVQANSYLIKPANFEELVAMVKAVRDYWSSLNVSPEP